MPSTHGVGPHGLLWGGGSGVVESVVAGTNVTVDSTDPANPIVSATGGGGSDLGWFNVMDYGATGDGSTDDTVAIQDAIDAAEAAMGGVVYFPAGVYVVNGALQDTGRSKSQLLLPLRHCLDDEQITIELRGEAPPPTIVSVVGDTPLPQGLSVIKGTLNTGSGGALLGGWGPAGSNQDFTNCCVSIKNLAFQLPANPVFHGLNLRHVSAIDLDNVMVHTGEFNVADIAEPTTTTSIGIDCPQNGNAAYVRLGAVNVVGFYNAYNFSEHTNGQQVVAWGCKRAASFAVANHASHFVRFMAVHCQTVLHATGAHYVDIDQLNIEHAASGWWVTVNDIDDSSNNLRGSINWHTVLAGTGVDSTFNVTGGCRLNLSHIGFRGGLEQIIVAADTTLGAKHANKQIFHAVADTSTRTMTIPANASVPFPIGTAFTFIVQNGSGDLSIAITSDTLRTAGGGATGTRTIADNGRATAIKIAATEWQIDGNGMT